MVKERIRQFLKKTSLPLWVKTSFAGVFDDMVAPLFSTEWGRRASWGVLGLFGLLLTVVVIQSVYDWYSDFVITQHSTVSRDKSVDNVSLLIAEIPDEHLFGKLGVSDQNALPITSLQLRLIGVIKSVPENLSRVIISEAGQPGKIYGVGDSLPSGITVNSITDDGVVLENGGRMEKLPLHRSSLSFQGMPQSLLDKEE